LTVADIAVVQNFEVVSDRYDIDRICTYYISSFQMMVVVVVVIAS